MNKVSKRRLAENQVVFRKANEQLKVLITELDQIEADEGEDHHTFDTSEIFQFFCECSDENCRHKVELSYDEYEKIHDRNDTFVIIGGHEVDEIEETVGKMKGYSIVRKYEVPSQSVEHLHATSLNNT